jgi:CysZ protein
MTHDAPPGPRAAGLLAGARYPFWGLRFVYVEHRSLARYWIWPILVTALAASAALYLVWTRHDALLELVWSEPAGEGWLGWLARAAYAAVDLLMSLFLAGAGLVASVLVGNLLAAPFNDALSEEVERLLTGRSGPPFSLRALAADVLRTVRLEGLKLLVYASVMLPLFVGSFFVPGVGQVAYTGFGFVFTALYFAIDYVDWPASRRRLGVRARLDLLRRHKAAMFGFGVGVWAFLWIPIVNLFFMPAAVAGGTKLYLDLSRPRHPDA